MYWNVLKLYRAIGVATVHGHPLATQAPHAATKLLAAIDEPLATRSLGFRGTASAPLDLMASSSTDQGAVPPMYNPCGGLQASAVRLEQADAFVNICHVTGSAWGNITAEILLEICCATLTDQRKQEAFEQIFAPVDGCAEAAQLFAASKKHHDVLGLFRDKALYRQLHDAAQKIQLHYRGLYTGQVRCLRATI